MSKCTLQLIFATIFSCVFIIGCGNADNTVALKNKRKAALKNAMLQKNKDPQVKQEPQVVSKQETIAEATKNLVDELKAKQKAEKAQTLAVDQARQEAEDKELKELITEIIHDNNEDVKTQTVNRVGEHKVWIDKENRQVIVGGKICLRSGPLELFVSPMGQKSHETIVTVDAWASQIHMCLALCGVMPGTPVEFAPIYKPAHGPKIEIEVVWKEGGKIIRRRAQDMIRNSETQKPMETHWVFGGSLVINDEGYYGDGGALVCLSNFAVATMDIPIKSVDSDAYLMYEALTENIPEVNTQVFLYFKPQIEDKDVASAEEIAAEVGRISNATPDEDN